MGNIPTKMFPLGVKSAKAPEALGNFLGVKVVANRTMSTCANLDAYRSASNGMLQFSKISFFTPSLSEEWKFTGDWEACLFCAYNGQKHRTDWRPKSALATGELYGRILDNSTSTKYGGYEPRQDVFAFYDYDDEAFENPITTQSDYSAYTSTAARNNFFGANKHVPILLVFRLEEPIDLDAFPIFRFYNAGDNNSQSGRTWTQGEILDSTDLKTWRTLAKWNSTSIPNRNNSVAYSASVDPLPGDMWSDLDLADRQWT